MQTNLSKFIMSSFKSAFDFMNPQLTNYASFSKSLSRRIKVKEGNNVQFSFDVELDNLFKKKLREFNISGRIFSEESGFYEFGDKKFRVVYDPFCNSSLASRGFLDAAAGLSIFSYDYEFITSAVMDYQTGVMTVVEDGRTKFYQVQTGDPISFNAAKNQKLCDSWVVITLETPEERININKAKMILSESKRVFIGSGHIYWLRLAAGKIDAYLDPFGGERLYEMFACTVAQNNGCIVTDLGGENFDPSKFLRIFDKNPEFVYFPVAATNKQLHGRVLKSLDS